MGLSCCIAEIGELNLHKIRFFSWREIMNKTYFNSSLILLKSCNACRGVILFKS